MAPNLSSARNAKFEWRTSYHHISIWNRLRFDQKLVCKRALAVVNVCNN